MAYDLAHSHDLTRFEERRAEGRERKSNGDEYHITVPPSMKNDIAAQRFHLEEIERSQRLQDLSLSSSMEHLQEENKRLLSQLDELANHDSSGMASRVVQYMQDLRIEKDKVRTAEKTIKKLTSELSRTQTSGVDGSADHECERLRNDVLHWKNKAERLERDVQLKVVQDEKIEKLEDQIQQWRSEAEGWKRKAAEMKGNQDLTGRSRISDQEYKRLKDELQRWKTTADEWKSKAEQQPHHFSFSANASHPVQELQAPPVIPPRDVDVRAYQNQIKQLEEELEAITKLKNELYDANQEWDGQYKKMKKEYEVQVEQLQKSLREFQGQLVKAIDNTDEEKTKREQEVRKVTEELSSARQTAVQSAQKVQTLEADYEQLHRDYEIVQGKLSRSSGLLREEQKCTCDLRRQVEQLRGRQHGFQSEEVELLKKQNELFRDDFDREKREKLQLHRDIEDLQKALRDKDLSRGGNQYQADQHRDLQRQVERYKRDLENEALEKQRLETDKQRLEREVTRLQNEMRSQESRLPDQRHELQAFRAQAEVFQTDYEREREEKKRIARQLSEQQRAMRSLETTNAALQQQVTQCEEDFEKERRDKEDYLRQLRRERSASSGQHRLGGSPPVAARFAEEEIREQQEAWARHEQRRRRDSEAAPPEPNIIGNVP